MNAFGGMFAAAGYHQAAAAAATADPYSRMGVDPTGLIINTTFLFLM